MGDIKSPFASNGTRAGTVNLMCGSRIDARQREVDQTVVTASQVTKEGTRKMRKLRQNRS